MKKKHVSNIFTAILILVIIGMGLFGVGYLQGWFDSAEGANACLTELQGTIRLYRSGVAFPAKKNTVLRDGDILTADPGATCYVTAGGSTLIWGQQAKLTVIKAEKSDFVAEIHSGELFASCENRVSLHLGDNLLTLENTVVHTSAEENRIWVFSGNADGISAGQTACITKKAGAEAVKLNNLSRFALNCLVPESKKMQLCVTPQQIAEAMRQEESLPEQGDGTCTLTIVCDTVLHHMSELTPSKAEFIPADGQILACIPVSFTSGETVFDLLKRVCDSRDIQLEYSWTPIHNSYYIEGIQHLYEFDCGSESGWMYQVNGKFPNYGCSAYLLQDGDTVVWAYSCRGYGADLGVQEWGESDA